MSVGPVGPDAGPTVEQDVRLIVLGDFTEDALGPERYRGVLARLAAAPLEYLQAFRAFVRQPMTASQLSELQLPWFLTLLARTDPTSARQGAAELMAAYERAAQEVGTPVARARRAAPETARSVRRPPPVTEHDKLVDRLEDRTAELQHLLQS
jgi:hypothetical protein